MRVRLVTVKELRTHPALQSVGRRSASLIPGGCQSDMGTYRRTLIVSTVYEYEAGGDSALFSSHNM